MVVAVPIRRLVGDGIVTVLIAPAVAEPIVIKVLEPEAPPVPTLIGED